MIADPSDRWIDVGRPSIGRQRRLSGTVAPLAELPLWIGIALALVPFLFPVLAFTAIYTVTMGSDPGQVTTSVDLAILLFGSVLVAPIAEELLFRGLVFGQLLSRGYGLLAAAVLSVLLFTVIHVFIAGLVSIAVAGVLGALLTVLRVWYDNLVGAWLMHALLNTAALLIALAVLPAPW